MAPGTLARFTLPDAAVAHARNGPGSGTYLQKPSQANWTKPASTAEARYFPPHVHSMSFTPLDKNGQPKKVSQGELYVSPCLIFPPYQTQPLATLAPNEIEVHTLLAEDRLKDGQRGLMLSPGLVHQLPTGWEATQRYDKKDLIFATLFFDKIEVPRNNIFSAPNVEIDFLLSQGVVQRSFSQIAISRPQNLDYCLNAAMKNAFFALDGENPGQWAVCNFEDAIDLFKGLEPLAGSGPKTAASLDLGSLFPVPNREVPFEDILNFKTKRNAELQRLRSHIDEVVVAAQAADHENWGTAALGKLSNGLEEYFKVCRESKIPMKLTNIKCKLNYKTVLGGAAAIPIISNYAIPDSLKLLLSAGAVISCLLEAELSPRLKPRNSPYEYIARYKRDFGF